MLTFSRAGALLGSWAGAIGGPIFARELRVASRKGLTYWIRFLYVIGLAFVLSGVLSEATGSAGTAAGTARAADAARHGAIIITLANFIVAQLVALSLLGAAMSDEARRRTLGTLLTTPISGRRFAAGMLLARLVQPLYVIALSFPCIALLRVFGGIPWELAAAGLAITVTATLFAGALALCLSVLSPRAASVSGLAGGLLILLNILPGIAHFAHIGAPWVVLASPYWMLAMVSSDPMSLTATPAPFLQWPLHCAIMLAAAWLCIAVAATMFRAIAMRHVFPAPKKSARAVSENGRTPSIRPVQGNAIVWKDGVAHRRVAERVIAIVLGALSLLAVVICLWFIRDVNVWMRILLVVILALGATAFIAPSLQASECMAREREARTWPHVLMLPLSDGEIVRWKLFALMRRNAHLWFALLLALFAVFVIQVKDGEVRIGQAALLLCVLVPRLASAAFLGLAIGLWVSATSATSRRARIETLLLCVLLPITVQMPVSMFSYHFLDRGAPAPVAIRYVLHAFAPMLVEIGLSLLFLTRAARRVRAAIG